MPSEWTVNDAIESGLQTYQEDAAGTVMPNIGQKSLAAGKHATWSLKPLLCVMACGDSCL